MYEFHVNVVSPDVNMSQRSRNSIADHNNLSRVFNWSFSDGPSVLLDTQDDIETLGLARSMRHNSAPAMIWPDNDESANNGYIFTDMPPLEGNGPDTPTDTTMTGTTSVDDLNIEGYVPDTPKSAGRQPSEEPTQTSSLPSLSELSRKALQRSLSACSDATIDQPKNDLNNLVVELWNLKWAMTIELENIRRNNQIKDSQLTTALNGLERQEIALQFYQNVVKEQTIDLRVENTKLQNEVQSLRNELKISNASVPKIHHASVQTIQHTDMNELVLGDSQLRDVHPTSSKVEIICIPGLKVHKVKDHINKSLQSRSFNTVKLVVGTNDVSEKKDTYELLNQYEDLLGFCRDHFQSVFLSSVLPRVDDTTLQQSNDLLNAGLEHLCEKLGCTFLNMDHAFLMLDLTINHAFFNDDGYHINREGTIRLLDYLCIEKSAEYRKNARPNAPSRTKPTVEQVITHSSKSSGAIKNKQLPTHYNIRYFKGAKDQLSNFTPCQMYAYGRWFWTLEAAYQYMKARFLGYHDLAEKIAAAKTGISAYNLGQNLNNVVSEEWLQVRTTYMRNLIDIKAQMNPEFKMELLQTGDRPLIEQTRNMFWACGENGNGQNVMGCILMQKRDELKMSSPLPQATYPITQHVTRPQPQQVHTAYQPLLTNHDLPSNPSPQVHHPPLHMDASPTQDSADTKIFDVQRKAATSNLRLNSARPHFRNLTAAVSAETNVDSYAMETHTHHPPHREIRRPEGYPELQNQAYPQIQPGHPSVHNSSQSVPRPWYGSDYAKRALPNCPPQTQFNQQPQVGNSGPPAPRRVQPRCDYCAESGHMKADCRHKDYIKCHSCLRFGHKAKFCNLF